MVLYHAISRREKKIMQLHNFDGEMNQFGQHIQKAEMTLATLTQKQLDLKKAIKHQVQQTPAESRTQMRRTQGRP